MSGPDLGEDLTGQEGLAALLVKVGLPVGALLVVVASESSESGVEGLVVLEVSRGPTSGGGNLLGKLADGGSRSRAGEGGESNKSLSVHCECSVGFLCFGFVGGGG